MQNAKCKIIGEATLPNIILIILTINNVGAGQDPPEGITITWRDGQDVQCSMIVNR